MNIPTLAQPASRMVCSADINLRALTHNLEVLNASINAAEPVCMVKANAYGHGLIAVASYLQNAGVKWFGVATVDEGAALREAGIKSRILVMSGAGAQFFAAEVVENQLTPLVSSLEEMQALASSLKVANIGPFPIHIDLDTGMTRGGFLSANVMKMGTELSRWLKIEGVSTHLAKAEESECDYSKLQIERLLLSLQNMYRDGLSPLYIHIDKSASILSQTSQQLRRSLAEFLPNAKLLIRPGIALYGIDPTKEARFRQSLEPVLSWKAPVVIRKSLPAGASIGYDCTFVTQRPSEIAIARVGYADGLKRTLSNRGEMNINGIRVPIVGRISMDLTALDVTDLVAPKGASSCEPGSFAYLIGGESENSQSAYDLATKCDTIPYEILTSIAGRVQRNNYEKRPLRN